MNETSLRWGIKVDRVDFPKMWSVGICLSHWVSETYIYVNLLFITVSIGKIYKED